MKKHSQQKQPAEIIPSVMDFVRVLPAGETLASADVFVTDSEGHDVTDGTSGILGLLAADPVVLGTQVQAKIQGGTDGETYKITFRAVTTPSGFVFEEDVELVVAEV